MFLQTLHELALKCQADFSDEGSPDEPGYGLTYEGWINSNYPWVYVDFCITGRVPLESLIETVERFRAACEGCPEVANYLSTTVSSRGLRCRLIYREDLKR